MKSQNFSQPDQLGKKSDQVNQNTKSNHFGFTESAVYNEKMFHQKIPSRLSLDQKFHTCVPETGMEGGIFKTPTAQTL